MSPPSQQLATPQWQGASAATIPLSRLPCPWICPRSPAAFAAHLSRGHLDLLDGGRGLILIGVAIVAAGVRNFSRAATPVPSNQPVRALVTTGIHGWSRNPIYVGMSLLYAGIGIAARSPWVLILALPLLIILRYGVVAREETYLERRFGDAYRDYKARVRRWL